MSPNVNRLLSSWSPFALEHMALITHDLALVFLAADYASDHDPYLEVLYKT